MAATSRGIDVSSYQGAQDWQALAKGGLTFVQVKASEGEHTRDKHYRMHMDGILKVGSLLPGAYHFAWPNQDARAEADNYIAAVKGDADSHPAFVHWLDLERRNDGANYAGCSAAEIRAYATAWVTRVRAAFPHQRVGVYTSGSDIKAGHYPANSDALWYPAYPAGAMSYTAAEQRSKPAPGVTPLFWQFTSSPLDRSIAYMTPAALRSWAGGGDLVALTDADVQKIARAVAYYDAVPAIEAGNPNANSDAKTNTTWTTRYAQYAAVEAARRAAAAAEKTVAQGAAMAAAITALAKDGGITAEQVQAAAEAGAQAALAELGGKLTAADDTEPAAS